MSKKYFYGHELSEEEIKRNRVSYATLSKCFDAVLCNEIEKLNYGEIWDNIECGELYDYYYEGNYITKEEAEALEDEGEEVDEYQKDFFQYYIVDDRAVYLLKEADEVVLYSPTLDVYIWAVDHYGTSWDYVFTNIYVK